MRSLVSLDEFSSEELEIMQAIIDFGVMSTAYNPVHRLTANPRFELPCQYESEFFGSVTQGNVPVDLDGIEGLSCLPMLLAHLSG